MTLSVINAPLLTEPVAKQTIHVGPPPVAIDASFTCKVVGPLTVRFTDTSTGEVTSRHWTAGDGNYTITSDPFWVYTYSQPGNYITTFRASGPGGDAPKVIHAITVPPPPIDPPVAEFSFKPTDGRAPLTVQFTDESTGAKTWLWTFGDGSTSTVQNPSHRFADPDTYAVSLTVSNGAGSDTATKTLEVEPTETPTPAQAYPPTLILYPTVSGSTVTVGGTSAAGTAGTAITRIGWDWGDGTTGDHAVPDTHAYAGTGSYTITVTAYQSDGQSTTRSVTVFVSVPTTTSPPTTTTPPVNAPIAAFTWSPDATDARLRRFTDTSTGPVTAWRWEFGDGTISTERNPAHVYPGEGTYRVLLTATGPGGASTAVRDLLVGGTETPYVTPTATPTTVPPTPAQAYPPTLILYPTVSGSTVTVGGTSAAGTAGTAITRIGWDWGDGTTGDHAVPDTHAYAGTGSYTITVTAYQSDGQSTTRSVTVFVSVPTTTSPPTTTTPPVNAPIAAFTWSPDATDARLRRFTDTSTGPVTAWRWEFGDGTISTERNPAHVYPGEGTYRVLLTATGPGGASTAVRDLLVGGTETPYVTPTATPTTVPPTATVVPVTPTPDVGDGGDGFPLWLVAIAAVGLLAGGVAVAARAVRPPSPPGKPAVPVLTIEPHGSLRRLDAGDRSIDGRAIEIEVRGGIRREQDSTGSAGAVRPGGALERDR